MPDLAKQIVITLGFPFILLYFPVFYNSILFNPLWVSPTRNPMRACDSQALWGKSKHWELEHSQQRAVSPSLPIPIILQTLLEITTMET